MKYKKIILAIVLMIFLVPSAALALIPLSVNQGGTGVNTITGIPYGTGVSPLSIVTIGSGLSFSGGTLSATGSGTVTSVSGTTNRITSTGGSNPVIDISATFEGLLGKVANPLSQFASTTSSQLAGVISDETGTGKLVFGTSPDFTTGITIGTIAVPTISSTSVFTNKDLTSGTNTFPTFNQNTTGSAATLTTSRTIGIATGDVTSAGSGFNGSANNTNVYTLATVNTNVGSFTNANITVNAKGLITAASNGSAGGGVSTIASADGSITVTGTTAIDLAVVKAPIWSTARLLAGNSVNGSANVAFANKFIVQGTTDTGLTGAQFLGALGTGIVKNTTTTGVLSIAVAADFPTLNQNTTGSAATLTTPRAINGVNFDGSAAITVTAAAGTLTGTTLNSTVVSSSLTSVGTLGSLTVTGNILNSALTASKVVFTDASKNLTSTGIGTSSQFIKGDGSLDSNTYITANQTITLSGHVTGSGTTAITTSTASKMILQGTTDTTAPSAQFLGALGTGLVKNTTTTGVLSIATAGTDYQAPVSLTTTGTSGNATFISNTLNIPNYTYTLPTATTSVLGGVKVDGTSITISSGVISATAGGSGTVTSVASADGSITVTNPTTTVDLAVVKAPILSTARTIGGVSFDGSAAIVPQTIQVTSGAGTANNIAFFSSATGNLQPLTDTGLTYNASSHTLTTTTFFGNVSGAGTVLLTATGEATNTVALVGSTNSNSRISTQSSMGTISATNSAAIALIIPTATEAASGAHPLISGIAIKNPTITNGTATTTNYAGLYIEGGTNQGTATISNNYALWVNADEARFDGSIGDTTNRITKGWFTDLQVTNAIAGSITGNAATATALATGRTIGITTGDATSSGSTFDGTANNTNALTLATVNSNVGSFTYGSFTVNAKGLITAASSGAAPLTNPMTTLGDIIYENVTPAATRLAGNTTATKNFLVQTGTGTVSAAPSWGTIAAGDVPTLNQNTTGSAATLTTPRAINGVNFDGSAPITVTAAAGTLTGTTLNSTVVTSSLTSVGTIATGVWNAGAVTSSGAVTGTSIVKSGGTSTQFLKADGSVDSSTYLTSAGAVTTLTGTASQVLVNGTSGTATSGAITLTLPQSIATTSTPQFARIGLGAAADASRILYVTGNVSGGVATIERTNTATNAALGTVIIKGTSTGVIADGFGAAFQFAVQGSGTAETINSNIQGLRDGADNNGELVFAPALAGTTNPNLVLRARGDVQISTPAVTSGLGPEFIYQPASYTGLTASTEQPDVNFNITHTVQFATGAITSQRAVAINAPTYAFVGASTITNAASFYVSGAPIVGTNATITNRLAMWVGSADPIQVGTPGASTGTMRFAGATSGFTTLTGNATGTGTITLPAATDTLVGRATTDTLTNKTIQGATITGALTGTGAYVPVTLLNSGTGASSTTFWRGDGTWATPSASGGLTVATTTISGGSTGQVLYDNAGVLGEMTNTGTGTVNVLQTSPTLITPVLGAATYTTLSGGAITDSSLTAGRVTFAGTAGLLSDSASLLYSATGGVATFTIGDTTTNADTNLKLSHQGAGSNGFYTITPPTPATGNGSQTITLPNSTTVLAGLATTQTFTGINTFTPVARTSGAASYLTINAPADTGITTATESIGLNVVGATRTWADGTVATQREYLFQAPTYNKTTTALTFTKTATLAVSGAPAAGTGVTMTNAYALWVQGGTTQLDGGASISRVGINQASTAGIALDAFVDGTTLTQGVRVLGHTTTDLGFSTFVSGDSFVRLTLQTNGVFNFGSGTAAGDTDLYRAGIGTLKTDTGFVATTGLGVGAGINASAFVNIGAGTTTVAPLLFNSGTNLTTPIAGANEFDGVQKYFTIDTSSGRGATPVQQYFHLTANGSAITTIANFFGTTSNINLVASGYYIIDIDVWYATTGTGADTFTFTNSAAPTSQNIHVDSAPAAGISSTPTAPLAADILNSTTAAQTYVTGSLTAGSHHDHFRIMLKNGTGTTLKIQATAGGTNITPQIGSYWTAQRISPNNIGTFAN